MITVHHLNFSRSSRILWLLEEIGVEYRLVAYERDANFRAPPSLKQVHPLGKAPVIQDGDLLLAESSSILTYIDDRYGDHRFTPPRGTPATAIHDEWLQYVESSAAFPIMITLIGGMTGGLPDALKGFTDPELKKALDYIASGVAPGPYLMGPDLTLADIQMSYLLASARKAGLLEGHDVLIDYLGRLEARPAFTKAIEVGGPLVPEAR